MKTKERIIKTIKELKQNLHEKYKIREIGIFGSIIREEGKDTSDIDLLVDFKEDAGLFDLIGLALFLEEKLHRRVDIVPKRALRKEIKNSVLKEVITL
ncbi:nucleotidyltransferase [Candidatus Atribacteria bacterium HGW-Atribacteria-1]|nr:MAG: nucleotidyltransferase [Candidatus Atribacteria bacterium HGW-Atribacteria-1]